MLRKCIITLMFLPAAAMVWLQLPARAGCLYLHWDSTGWHVKRQRDLPATPTAARSPAEWWIRLDRHVRIERQTAPSALPNRLNDLGPLGFGTFQITWGASALATVRWLRISLWIPFGIFAAYPTIVLFRGPLRAARRRRQGLCLGCGYSLRGNTSGVCPECGKAVPYSVASKPA
ncbi:MAG TPA: hypothetical protein VGM03_10745 [Phycisphaerae bacterium]|jgi:hypothetical protein